MNIELSNKTILVTGGAGFIGSNLCEALLEKGNKVVCLDNFATGKRENIKEFFEDPNFTLIEGDIRELEDCLKATKDVDYVLHQAALGSVPRSIKDPITSNDVNVSGFLNMLVAARDIPHSLASIEKAKELLDYQPAYSIEDGLEQAVKWN